MKNIILIIFVLLLNFFLACSEKNQWDSIEKNEKYRKNIESGNFVELSGGFTYFELENQKNLDSMPLIVFVHGFSVPSYIWDNTFVESVNRGYPSLRYDVFGRGHSSNPPVHYTSEFLSNQLSELLDTLQIENKINLIGLSFGGVIISEFAYSNIDNLNHLIYVDPSGFWDKKLSPLASIEINETEINEFIKTDFPTRAKDQLNDFHDPNKFQYWSNKYKPLLNIKGFARALMSTKRNFKSMEIQNKFIGSSDINVHHIWGKFDKVIDKSQYDFYRKKLMPNASYFLVDNSGHLPNVETPNKFNQILFDTILEAPLP